MLQIIPAVDVLDGKVVRLMHGDYDRVTVYGEDPVAQALEWMRQGAELVHVVDLEGARSGAPDESLWRRLAEAGVAFQVGGGIRTAEIADRALDAGARRVVLGTAAVWDPDILGRILDPARVVAAVDVRQESVASNLQQVRAESRGLLVLAEFLGVLEPLPHVVELSPQLFVLG